MAELEARIAVERKSALTALPVQFGFADMDAFIRTLREAGGRKWAPISNAQRTEVKQLLPAGKTGAEIAVTTSLSLPLSRPSKSHSAWSRRERRPPPEAANIT